MKNQKAQNAKEYLAYLPADARDTIVEEVEHQLASYKRYSSDTSVTARKELIELSAESLKYFRLLRGISKRSSHGIGLAETLMRQVMPRGIHLEDLAEDVLRAHLAANSAYPYLPARQRHPRHNRDRLVLSLLLLWRLATGKTPPKSREHDFYHFVVACLKAVGETTDPYASIRKAIDHKLGR